MSRNRNCSAFRLAVADSLPVLFGYVPLGITFGVLFQSLGYAWVYAPLAGIVIYAGSAQFMAVGLIASGVSLVEAFLATFALNFRHVFYGLSLFDRFPRAGPIRWYLIYGLTDETYALIAGKSLPEVCNPERYYFNLTLLNQCYWVSGCAIGAGLQSRFNFDSRGFEFTLVALFLVLLIEQVKAIDSLKPIIVSILGAISAFALFDQQFMAAAIGFCVLIIGLGYPWETFGD